MTMDNYDGCDAENYDWYFGVPFKSKRKAAAVKGREFKVGDRVRVVKDGWGDGGSFHGSKVGAITTIKNANYGEGVLAKNGWAYRPHEIELLPHYARGTRIKLLRNHGVYKAGHRGTVTIENDENVGVLMDIGRFAAFPHDVVGVADDTAPDCAGRKMEREFKAGDDVRALHDCKNGGYCKGDTFTVQSGHGDFFEFVDNDGDQRYRFTAEFELVTPAPSPQDNEQQGWDVGPIFAGSLHLGDGTAIDCTSGSLTAPVQPQSCIVALISNGKPRPSQWPHVHPDSTSATAEAERLAKINPGQEFAVYQRVAGRVASVTVEMKEVA